MSDKASSIFQCAQSVGCILGPVLGGFLNDLVRFQSTCDIMAVTCFGYACLLYYRMRKEGKIGDFNHIMRYFYKNKVQGHKVDVGGPIEMSLFKTT
jgi:MFS family permease